MEARLVQLPRHAIHRPRRRRRIAAAAVALGGAAVAVLVVAQARDRSPPAATAAALHPTLIARFRPDTGQRFGAITPAGEAMIYSSGTTAWREDRGTGVRTSIPVPDGLEVDSIDVAGDVVLFAGLGRGGQRELWRAGAPPVRLHAGDAFLTALAPTGDRVAVTTAGRVVILDAADGAERDAVEVAAPPMALGSSPGGGLTLARDDEGVLLIEEAAPGSPPRPLLRRDLGGLPLGLAWTSPRTIAIAMTTPQLGGTGRGFIVELDASGGGAPRILLDRDGEMISNLIATPAGLFFSSILLENRILLGRLDDLDDTTDLALLPTGSPGEGTLAGWLDDDTLMFTTRRGAEMMPARQRRDGPLELLGAAGLPVAVDGDALLLLRTTGERCAVIRSEGGVERTLVERPCTAALNLTCAGTRPPCLVGEGTPGRRSYAPLDVERGTIGPTAYLDERPWNGMAPHTALSPDGRLLAIAHFGDEVDVVEVATGARRILRPGHGERLQCLGWSHDGGYLLATDTQRLLFAIGRLDLDGGYRPLVTSPHRVFCRPRVSPDGRWLAVTSNDVSPSYWLLERR
jgi:hypothetical protein